MRYGFYTKSSKSVICLHNLSQFRLTTFQMHKSPGASGFHIAAPGESVFF